MEDEYRFYIKQKNIRKASYEVFTSEVERFVQKEPDLDESLPS